MEKITSHWPLFVECETLNKEIDELSKQNLKLSKRYDFLFSCGIYEGDDIKRIYDQSAIIGEEIRKKKDRKLQILQLGDLN